MSKGKYIFHSINSIRSRPDDNPQSKNRTIFEQTFTEASEGVGLMDSSASSGTKYVNQPWICSLTSHQNLVAAHPSVRGRGSPDLLPKFIAASDDLARAGPGPQPTEPMTSFASCTQLWGFSRTHYLKLSRMSGYRYQPWTKWSPPTTRSISSGSANSTFELKWLRKSCCSQELRGQGETQKGNTG